MEDNILDELLNDENPKESNEHIIAPLIDEVNLIQDYGARLFVRSLLFKAPKAFWIGAASASGKWHPPDERGEGGNVLHTKRVVRIVRFLAEAQDRSQYQTDILTAAAILHDLLKNIEWADGTLHNDRMHPYTVDAFVDWARGEDKKYSSEVSDSTLYIEETMMHEILRLVRCHMGMWSPIPETIPITQMDWTLHIADMIGAKLHDIIDGEEIKESRWRE